MSWVGQVVDNKYKLIRLLGEGGMGAVYEAEHILIRRRCAVKFLHPEIARNQDIVRRFIQEAQAAAAIGHKGIIDIYDVGTTQGGATYIVMEYLDGASLAERLEGGKRLAPAAAAEVAVQALGALAFAHKQGIVHRDIKPDNLFLTQQPGLATAVKVLDFGIARMRDPAEPQGRMTATGALLGTPYYMAPEQARGVTDVDHRIDIYAMGVVLYEAVTGRVPFEGQNVAQIMFNVLTTPLVRPRQIDPSIPERLEAVILKAMERDRDVRYQSAEDMIRDLLPLLDAEARARAGVALKDSDALRAPAGGTGGSDPRKTATPAAAGDDAPIDLPRGRPKVAIAAAVAGVAIAAAAAALLVLAPWKESEPRGAAAPAAAVQDAAGVLPPPVVEAASPDAPLPSDAVETATAEVGPIAQPAGDPAVAPLPGPVTIAVKDLPAGAVVLFGGVVMPDVPFKAAPGATPIELEIRVPGYEPYKAAVTPDRDTEVTPAFEPLRRTGRRGAGTTPPGAGTTPGEQTAATQPPRPPVQAGRDAGAATVHGSRGTERLDDFE